MLRKRKIALLLAALLLCLCGTASATVMAIYQGGRVMPASALTASSCSDPSTGSGDPQLVATFNEQVNGAAPPATLTLHEDEGESGQVDVQVSIVQACTQGQIAFKYRHESDTASGDLDITPREFTITLDLVDGASASQSVSYSVIDDDQAEDQETVDLVGYQVTFFVGGATGGTSGHRVLAHVVIPANNEKVVDDDDVPDDVTMDQIDVIETLNTACSMAVEGSDLAETCGIINTTLDGDDPITRRKHILEIADELDPEIVTLAPASLVAIGRTQFGNVHSRLQSLHSSRGAGGGNSSVALNMSIDGLALGTGLFQNLLSAADDQGGGGGSRLLSEKWGFFLNGSFNFGDKGAAADVPVFDFKFYGVTGGADYRFDNGVIVGAAVGYTRFDADLSKDGGEAKSNAISVMGFGTFDIVKNLYVDATVGYSKTDYEQDRVVDLSDIGGLPKQNLNGSTDVNQISASASLNYRVYLGKGWTVTPYGSIYYATTDADAFAEKGGSLALSYEGYSFDSLLSSLGLRATTTINTSHGVISPFLDLAFQHESEKNAFNIETEYVAVATPGPLVSIGDPDRDFGTVGAGAVWVFPTGNQIFLRASSQVASSEKKLYSISIGGRIEF